MKVAVLIDNNPHHAVDFLTEHGLSIYFEADGYKWLLDVGASDQFAKNAENMGIDIGDIDYLILSHAHSDHTGGLSEFVKRNSHAKIILSSHIKGKSFISNRREIKRSIGIDYSLVEQELARFVMANSNKRITENVSLLCNIPTLHKTPKANEALYVVDEVGEKLDVFNHEIVLTVNTPNGLVVFSACSHNGLLNILAACSDQCDSTKIKACIGGTHLVDSKFNQYESDPEIEKIGKTIIELYPEMQLIAGHCTGENAKKVFLETVGDNFSPFYSGMFLEV